MNEKVLEQFQNVSAFLKSFWEAGKNSLVSIVAKGPSLKCIVWRQQVVSSVGYPAILWCQSVCWEVTCNSFYLFLCLSSLFPIFLASKWRSHIRGSKNGRSPVQDWVTLCIDSDPLLPFGQFLFGTQMFSSLLYWRKFRLWLSVLSLWIAFNNGFWCTYSDLLDMKCWKHIYGFLLVTVLRSNKMCSFLQGLCFAIQLLWSTPLISSWR